MRRQIAAGTSALYASLFPSSPGRGSRGSRIGNTGAIANGASYPPCLFLPYLTPCAEQAQYEAFLREPKVFMVATAYLKARRCYTNSFIITATWLLLSRFVCLPGRRGC